MLGGAPDGLRRGVDGGPVEVVCDQAGREELRVGAQNDPVFLHILAQHVCSAVEALAQASALPDGVADGTCVGADDLAAGVDELALGVGFAGVAFQKAHIIPVRDEADVLGIPLFGVEEALLCGDGADVVLAFKFAQREAGVGQLLLGQKIQDVALILGEVPCLFQQPPTPLLTPFDPGVVARDDGLTA